MIKIPLPCGRFALVDDEDAWVAEKKWNIQKTARPGIFYARRMEPRPEKNRRYSSILLHRTILGLSKDDPFVDHINGDGLDCRRQNLRPADRVTNGRNRGGATAGNRTTGALGVHLTKRGIRRFQVKIMADGVSRYVGCFETIEEAIAARLAAEKELWGIQPRRAAAHNTTGDHP